MECADFAPAGIVLPWLTSEACKLPPPGAVQWPSARNGRWAFEVGILKESLTRTLSVLIDGRVDKLIDWLFEVVI
jgi:hypothetical protein